MRARRGRRPAEHLALQDLSPLSAGGCWERRPQGCGRRQGGPPRPLCRGPAGVQTPGGPSPSLPSPTTHPRGCPRASAQRLPAQDASPDRAGFRYLQRQWPVPLATRWVLTCVQCSRRAGSFAARLPGFESCLSCSPATCNLEVTSLLRASVSTCRKGNTGVPLSWGYREGPGR